VVAGEVVGLEEQPDPAPGLVADPGRLGLVGGDGQEEVRAGAAGRAHADPAPPAAQVGVLHQVEAHRVPVEGDGLVVVADEERDGGDAGHRAMMAR
jgi:hypothetical protein